jgi:hypothetical protein
MMNFTASFAARNALMRECDKHLAAIRTIIDALAKHDAKPELTAISRGLARLAFRSEPGRELQRTEH